MIETIRYIPQNRGLSGGVSWFATYNSSAVETIGLAEQINKRHKEFFKDSSIEYRILKRIVRDMKYSYHKDGTKPVNGEIFVFGSNLAGIHGAGAAKEAMKTYGAIYKKGMGLYGQSYAIPTKDFQIMTLSLHLIKEYILGFRQYAEDNPHHKFWITRIGCGLAGLSDSVVAPLFSCSPLYCDFPEQWKKYLDN